MSIPHGLGLAIAVLFTVGFVNFFNFMDGINGIAAAQGIWGGLAISILLMWGRTNNSVLSAAALAGACLGFLPHNFPKARMFLGDVGSTDGRLRLAMFTLVGARHTKLPWIAFILPLGPFIYDALFTLIKRVLNGENFLKAHRQHHYQMLVRCGWSHTAVTSVQMALMTVSGAAALVYAQGNDATRLVVLIGLLAVFVGYSVFVYRYSGDTSTSRGPHRRHDRPRGAYSGD